MSSLPAQVQKEQAEIEEMERQILAAQTPPEPPAAPVEPVTPPVEPVAVPPAAPAPAEPKWEQKYRTLKGMFDAQVPDLHKQVKEMTRELAEVRSQLATRAAEPAASTPEERLVTAQDESNFGAELIDVQRRVAEEVMRKHVAPLQDELRKRDQLIAQLQQATQKTSGEVTTMTFEQKLYAQIPDFDAINSSPEWIDWLDEPDEFSGEPRRAFAEFAYNNANVAKLKAVVDHFKKSQAPAVAAPAPAEDPRQREMRLQAQPSRTTTGSAAAASPVFYTEAEATRMFEKVRKLNQAGKNEEANTLETEVSAAYMEGRVRG